jgi:hypothetical protein
MIYARPADTFDATTNGAPTGLTGTLGVRVIDQPAGATMLARTTAGISEQPPGSGIYSVTLIAPAIAGSYLVVWDTGGATPVYASEELQVAGVTVADVVLPPAGSYVSTAEFVAYAAPFTVTDPDELARTLERASRDVDAYCGPTWREDDGSAFGDLVVNPKGLAAWQLVALKNATAAQALYRIQNGEDWALGGGDLSPTVTGPDFTTQARPRFSPQARQELAGSGLVVRSARLGAR